MTTSVNFLVQCLNFRVQYGRFLSSQLRSIIIFFKTD